MTKIRSIKYITDGEITIYRASVNTTYQDAANELGMALDSRHGVLFSSSYEYPGRYTRWDIGFVDPPLMISSSGRSLTFLALNQRGEALTVMLKEIVRGVCRQNLLETECPDLRDRLAHLI